jgi:acyl-CoA synthetase (AMP-forming)/AMP-acid ligase II
LRTLRASPQCVYRREGGFDPHKQLEFLSRHKVTNVFTTPTAMRSMMAIENAATRYPQVFRRVCSAGEPLNPEAIRWFREQYGLTVLDYYGLTESYPLVANYPFLEVRQGSMGKPMPGWDVKILDEDGRPVEQGARGEICLRARSNPHYPLGYWQNEQASAETFGGNWFHTKDAAVQDDDGYFWYVGRADDVIIAAGYRIGPLEVESACLEHPAVRETAVVASPDELRGNVHDRVRSPARSSSTPACRTAARATAPSAFRGPAVRPTVPRRSSAPARSTRVGTERRQSPRGSCERTGGRPGRSGGQASRPRCRSRRRRRVSTSLRSTPPVSRSALRRPCASTR